MLYMFWHVVLLVYLSPARRLVFFNALLFLKQEGPLFLSYLFVQQARKRIKLKRSRQHRRP